MVLDVAWERRKWIVCGAGFSIFALFGLVLALFFTRAWLELIEFFPRWMVPLQTDANFEFDWPVSMKLSFTVELLAFVFYLYVLVFINAALSCRTKARELKKGGSL